MDVASASSSTPNAAAGVATAMSAHQASTSCLFRIMQYGLQHEHVTSRQHICQSSFPQGQATHRRAPLRTLFNERTASLVGVRPRVLPVFFRASSAGAQYEERGASEEVRLLFPRRWTDGPCAVRVRRSYRCGRRAGHNALGNRWRKWNEKIPGISTIVLVLREPKAVVGSMKAAMAWCTWNYRIPASKTRMPTRTACVRGLASSRISFQHSTGHSLWVQYENEAVVWPLIGEERDGRLEDTLPGGTLIAP